MKYGRYAVKRLFALLLALLLALGLSACGGPAAEVPSSAPPAASDAPEIRESLPPVQTPPAGGEQAEDPAGETPDGPAVAEDGWYSSKEEVAIYIHLYGRLPDNYVTKQEAQELGWTGGSVERYAGEGTAIGGSRFGNYEGLLPEAEGRVYTECDIGTVGGTSRGAERVVFSNDGLVYYTGDHYESFELLYGEP